MLVHNFSISNITNISNFWPIKIWSKAPPDYMNLNMGELTKHTKCRVINGSKADGCQTSKQ